ncbi:MAG: hypothetical protein J6S71_10140 [Clostridia bacterium]|nr:hypothetical protein [Clostridia bacterium]
MKKKILALALIVICLSIVAYGTTAYFTYDIIATHVITAGNVRIELEQLAILTPGGAPIEFDRPNDIVPGTSVSKIVQVKNTGYAAAWVRLALTKEIILASGVTGEVDLSLVSYEINEEYWAEQDGWFYYLKPLEAGATTEPIFTEISFAASMSNMYQKSQSKINVLAHAVQTVYNGESVFEAAGWPEA